MRAPSNTVTDFLRLAPGLVVAVDRAPVFGDTTRPTRQNHELPIVLNIYMHSEPDVDIRDMYNITRKNNTQTRTRYIRVFVSG